MKNILIALGVLLLTACAKTPDWDYDRDANFANYKTFAFVEGANLSKNTTNYQISPLMEKRVRDAVENVLSVQGFQLVDKSKADVLINYLASVETKIDKDTMTFGTSMGPYPYSARWSSWGISYNTHTTTREYEVGTLILDVIDAKTNMLVWRGAKEGRLKKNQTPAKRAEVVNSTVAEILSNFPPKSNN